MSTPVSPPVSPLAAPAVTPLGAPAPAPAAVAANAPPVAADDALSAHETALIKGDLFADHGHGPDHDPEGDALRVVAVQGQADLVGLGIDLAAGRVRILSDGTFWFDTAGDFGYLVGGETVQVSFTYTVADAAGATDTATATVTVTGANDAPLLYPDFIYVNEAGTGNADVFAFNGVGVDTDPEGAPLKVVDFLGGTTKAGELGELPGGGVARLMQDGTLWFRADGDYDAMRPGEVAQVTFTYRATDGQFTRTSHVTLIIEGRNTAPVARNDHFSTDEEKVKSGWLFADNGEGADSDVDSDGWAVLEVNRSKANVGVSFDLPEGGRLRVMETGQFWFNPLDDFDHLDAGETETVSFTYTIDDQAGGYSRATVEIVVHGISYLPVIARDDVVTITEKATLDFDFLKDDYENPDDAPEVVGVSFAPSGPGTYPGPDGGSLTLNPDGRSIHFDPGTDFDFLRQGQQERFEFDYEIEDRNGDRSTATVEIRVNGRNDAPVAQDDHFEWSLTSGGAMNVFADNGSGADFDADAGDALQVGGLRTGYYSQWFWGLGPLHIPGGGTATITSAGDLTLNPHSEDIEGYKGTTFEGGDLEAGDQVTLTYRLLDASGLYSDPATVIIDVIA